MKDVRDKNCDCYQDCIKLYDETDFKSIQKSECNTDTCGWREDFYEADFQASCELNED